jgi:uncharacterized membrane protein YfcA
VVDRRTRPSANETKAEPIPEKTRKSTPLGTDPALAIPTRQGTRLDLAYWDLWFALVATRDCGGEPGLLADRLAWLFGFGAGVLGGAYGMNGPPLVIYGSLRRWSPEHFRATLQGYFLPASLVGMVGYRLAGLWVPAVTRDYLMSLPVVLAAIFLGRVVNRRMNGRPFLLYVHVGLVAIGVVLLIQSVWGPART